ncbi:MAG: S8 family serine peptidase [Acidimicrobiia bacterium]|nr:S8 family serine peptidase [Acidimicrobiia bacterium]
MEKSVKSTSRGRLIPLLVLAMLASLGLVQGGAAQEQSPAGQADAASDTKRRPELEPAMIDGVVKTDWVDRLGRGDERQVFLVRLTDPAAPSYDGGREGLAPIAPDAGEKFNPNSQAAREYTAAITADQDAVIERAGNAFGRDLEVRYRYTYADNGFAAVMTPDEARQLAEDPAVEFIQRNFERELHTDRGPEWIEADHVWNGSTDLGLPENYLGEGMIIGVIDTGINPSNPSFADVGGDGYDHTNPLGEGNFLGVCDSTNTEQFDPNFPCNDKLIGAYGFLDEDYQPRPDIGLGEAVDYDGHGSHTASTAGGNFVDEAEKVSPTRTDTFNIKGVAPHANIISYLGCCSGAALTASIDQAIADQVDAINYSIGSAAPSPDLWNDFDARGFLNARAAGIFVATSNGNTGPGFATTGSPADAPWLISVGASTHDRANLNSVIDMSGGDTTPPANIDGRGVTSELGPTPIVYAGDFGDPLCDQTTGNETNFGGNIVVCDRGVIGRVEKSFNVAAQGAAGFVLANDAASGGSLNGDAFAIPGVHITFADGNVLKDWLASGSGHTASISGTTFDVNDAHGDLLAGFSSRGPNRAVETVVPDVTAPGVDIIAAYGAGHLPSSPQNYGLVEYNFISGTSMASPHVAGAGALMAQAHTDWTPAEIQSALMTSAVTGLTDSFDGSVTDPYDIGAGRVDVARAVQTQLVFDETEDDYLAANPAEGGDPKTLNLPSFNDQQCLSTCSWTRTAEVPTDALVPGDISWTASVEADPAFNSVTVSPNEFTVAPGDTQDLTVSADVAGAPDGETIFARITLTPSDPAVPEVTMPVAVLPSNSILPGSVEVETRRDAGSFTIADLISIEITDFTGSVEGLVKADPQTFELPVDPTNGDPYDTPDGTQTTLIDVGSNATRLIAELSDSEASDMDLYVGLDSNGDGQAELSEEVATSTTATADEFVDISDPEAGSWWILTQNWAASNEPPDAVTMSSAVVEGVLGNAEVHGPDQNPQEEPWDVVVSFDESDMEPGDSWFGTVVLGSSPDTPDDIGRIPIRIDRVEDDVTKTASVDVASPGDTVSYDITIQPNVTDETLTYSVADHIPDGLTVDPDSITGGGALSGDTIEWTVEMPTPDTSPLIWQEVACPAGYLDLAGLGIFPASVFDGDALAFNVFADVGPFDFYGTTGDNLVVTENGLLTLPEGFGGDFQTQQTLPDDALPNSVIGGLWTDLIAEYVAGPAGSESGVSLASTGAGGVAVVEYDNMQLPDGGVIGDFQIWVQSQVADGQPEIEFHYLDNGDVSWSEFAATIGVENADGSDAFTSVNNSDPSTVISGDTSICYDWDNSPLEPVTLSYDAVVDADAEGDLVNTVEHITDDPFAQPITVTETVTAEPPSLEAEFTAEPDRLWPPNHKLREVTVSAVDQNGDPLEVTILDVTSSQPDSGMDPEDVPNDIEITGPDSVDLRAERFDESRIYTIEVEATDGTDTVTGAVEVVVPMRATPPGRGPSTTTSTTTTSTTTSTTTTTTVPSEPASFEGIGELPGSTGFESRGFGVSGDGSAVTGRSWSGNGPEAFQWKDGAMTALGDLAEGGFSSSGNDLSLDGSVVVGYGESAETASEAFIWKDGTMTGLGFVGGSHLQSWADGVSDDGSVVAGATSTESGIEAFRWDDGTMTPLGDLDGGNVSSAARGVSGDGSVVAGKGTTAEGTAAFRWIGGTMTSLGDLPGGSVMADARAISADGSVVVGYSNGENGYEAFRWEDDVMTGLGDLSGGNFLSFGRDTSGNGSVVVGYATSDSGREAMIWTETGGMRSLKALLEDDHGLDLTGWTLQDAYAISHDGSVIVGEGSNPNGDVEAWRAVLP